MRRTLAALILVIGGMFIPASAEPDMVAMRTRYFGAANVDATGAVDPSKVIVSWFGVTNFAASIGGHVVLLDAWVPRGEYSGYVPSSPSDLIALKPEFLFVGHAHFDHNADAAEVIAGSPSTRLVGTPEHCAQIRRQAAPAVVSCIDSAALAAAPGAVRELTTALGWSNVGVTAVKHVHSAGRAPDASDPHTPTAPTPDLGAVAEHMPGPADTQHLVRHLGDGEGGTVLYQFRVGAFALTWNDSAGPLKEDAPGVFDVLRALPPTDVEIGAIMGFNQITNGLRDPRMYIEALQPKVFMPSHHDNWAPPVSTKAANYRPFVEEELAKIPAAQRPELLFLTDPGDYVRPVAWDTTDARWS